jgi:hypothetical protein
MGNFWALSLLHLVSDMTKSYSVDHLLLNISEGFKMIL